MSTSDWQETADEAAEYSRCARMGVNADPPLPSDGEFSSGMSYDTSQSLASGLSSLKHQSGQTGLLALLSLLGDYAAEALAAGDYESAKWYASECKRIEEMNEH